MQHRSSFLSSKARYITVAVLSVHLSDLWFLSNNLTYYYTFLPHRNATILVFLVFHPCDKWLSTCSGYCELNNYIVYVCTVELSCIFFFFICRILACCCFVFLCYGITWWIKMNIFLSRKVKYYGLWKSRNILSYSETKRYKKRTTYFRTMIWYKVIYFLSKC